MTALVARLDGFDGVLLTGPAVRAVAARSGAVTMLCTPAGAPAARLLPHVDDVVVGEPAGPEGAGGRDAELLRRRTTAYDTAVVLTPSGHSPLPVARLLRSVRGAARIGAEGTSPPESSMSATGASPAGTRPRQPSMRPPRWGSGPGRVTTTGCGYRPRRTPLSRRRQRAYVMPPPERRRGSPSGAPSAVRGPLPCSRTPGTASP
ncbi:glycosyltransferase family 9 protein [Streptomyces sp. NPDC014006]|uniref:glycosyltransferase family 9 protein n=1 Tax=Streptomyces sp. NPDC014006 TaxID=3364870 RepID=UPI0036FD074E